MHTSYLYIRYDTCEVSTRKTHVFSRFGMKGVVQREPYLPIDLSIFLCLYLYIYL